MAIPNVVDLAGRTTTAAARSSTTGHADLVDDTSPLLSRRQWIELAWGTFTAASLVALAATGRMMFPNVLDEPSQQFKAGTRSIPCLRTPYGSSRRSPTCYRMPRSSRLPEGTSRSRPQPPRARRP